MHSEAVGDSEPVVAISNRPPKPRRFGLSVTVVLVLLLALFSFDLMPLLLIAGNRARAKQICAPGVLWGEAKVKLEQLHIPVDDHASQGFGVVLLTRRNIWSVRLIMTGLMKFVSNDAAFRFDLYLPERHLRVNIDTSGTITYISGRPRRV